MMMEKSSCLIFCVLMSCAIASPWNNLNCPAPRAPDNGLSFIFRNGELIHFRCHPGYLMRGKAVAHCVNNQWTHPAPQCVPIRKNALHPNTIDLQDYYSRSKDSQGIYARREKHRQLFNWGEQTTRNGVYGDGPRRLPLINGIWPPQNQAEQVLALGIQSTPGPKTMIKEEIGIAELRHRQLEELKKQRFINRELRGKRKNKKNRRKNSVHNDNFEPRETILALGSTEEGQAFSVALSKRGKIRHKSKPRQNKKKAYPSYGENSNYIASRRSRVDNNGIFNKDVGELRRRPVEEVQLSWSNSDASCIEYVFGRSLPKLAPQVKSAFVHRYETKRNKNYPFNEYMIVKYRCLTGYHFANSLSQTFFCKNGTWIGDTPECVENSMSS